MSDDVGSPALGVGALLLCAVLLVWLIIAFARTYRTATGRGNDAPANPTRGCADDSAEIAGNAENAEANPNSGESNADGASPDDTTPQSRPPHSPPPS